MIYKASQDLATTSPVALPHPPTPCQPPVRQAASLLRAFARALPSVWCALLPDCFISSLSSDAMSVGLASLQPQAPPPQPAQHSLCPILTSLFFLALSAT